jgi:uncharacterized protein YidB (DUF937 family)
MGLLDVINGMLNGPRGRREAAPASGGGMSPIMMALLGLLAYKALKSGRSQSAPRGSVSGRPDDAYGGTGDPFGGLFGGGAGGVPRNPPMAGGSGGAGNWPGGMGSFLGGAAAGTMLSSGLSNLIKGFQESGYGGPAQSWVGSGPNQEIAPGDLERALGSDTLDALSQQTGMGREELLRGLSENLPDFIDQLTPDGRLPSGEGASHMI